MKSTAFRTFLRSLQVSLLLCMAAVGLFLGICAAWEGIQSVAAQATPSVALLADGRLRVLDRYISF